MGKSIQEYFDMARAGTLPAGFDQWELADNDGWTVAHEAARAGTLPRNFCKWMLHDIWGWTVAHEAATNGRLPVCIDG